MPIKTLYFDESGFTGYNLLDPDQPVFMIASSDLAEQEAADILQRAFPRYQAPEFKFSNIWASNRNRRGLIEFGRACATLGARAYMWRTDKRFAVLTKVIDFLIEPYLHDMGYDFYADGFARKYSNYIHYGLTECGEPALYDSIIRAYQEFSRAPSEAGLERLQIRLRLMANSLEEPLSIFLDQMAIGAEVFERYRSVESFTGADELYVTTMLAIIGHWRQRSPDDFAVVHDDSAHFFRHREMWETITSPNVPPQMHVAGDGSEVPYPLRVVSTTPTPSEQSRSIQFCDVLAGVSAKIFDERIEGDDRQLLNDAIVAGLGELTFNGIRPEPEFPDRIPPPPLDGPDAVDRMVGVIFRDRP
jgi:hypothetical protein